MSTVIDFNAIIEQWLNINNNENWTCNLDNIKLGVKSVQTIFKLKPAKNNGDSTMNVTFTNCRLNTSQDALALIRASINRESTERVLIEKGVVRGLTRNPFIIKDRDRNVEIDFSVPVSEKRLGPAVHGAVETHFKPGVTPASVLYTENRYKGQFEFDVVVTGKVTFSKMATKSACSYDIVNVINDLKNSGNEFVEALRVENGMVEFTVKGEVEIRNQCQPIIQCN